MENLQVRVYAVTKKNGNWDVLNRANVIPKTVETVHITWGNGKEKKDVPRETFIEAFKHSAGSVWVAK